MTPEENERFEQFYRQHLQKLLTYAYRYLHDWEEAKDATQEAFLVGMKKIDQFLGSENQVAWMKNVIRKKASNMRHTRKLREEIVVPLETLTTSPHMYDSHEDEDVEALLDHCAELLKSDEYSLFVRIIWKRESYSHVSRELNISEWACRKRIQRILKKLNENWDKEK